MSPTGTTATSPRPRHTAVRTFMLGLAVVLIAFNLRTLFASLAVLLPEVIRDTGLSASSASYLTTLPLLCLGIFAPVASRLGERFGVNRAILGAIALLGVALALRASGVTALLFVAVILAGAGIAVGNVLLPVVVKREFPSRVGMMTACYTMAICAGASLAAATTLPITQALDEAWTLALGAWAIPALVAALVWAPHARGGAEPVTGGLSAAPVWRASLAWQVSLFMGLQSSLAFVVFSWLAPILRARGVAGVETGYVIATVVVAQIAGCLITPILAVRCRDQRLINAVLAVAAAGGLTALLFAPLSGRWMWAVVLGTGQGGLLAVALTMIVLRSPNARTAARLSGMAQCVGYALAATVPWLLGVLHDRTGDHAMAGVVFVAVGVGLIASGLGAGRNVQLPPGPAAHAPLPRRAR